MNVPPLCIIQARYNSTRLPGKMLLTLPGDGGSETLVARAWRLACEAFGRQHCVVAIPRNDIGSPLGDELARIGASVFAWAGQEENVLSRFYACAHKYRWHPDSVLVRWTPDDPFKVPMQCRRVANGERLPVELGAEAFTLEMLDAAMRGPGDRPMPDWREHITYAIFPPPPPIPQSSEVWTVDTQEDYDAAIRRCLRERAHA
jgi:spore coat polysaccharide biosynthesis protein SpsF (cytidylyltransferase family)